jgi:exodeoxyribonuclease VII small subunit
MIVSRVGARMNDSPPETLTFEQALAALEQTVRQLEDGQVGLEESLACYERGIGLLRRCYAQLQQAEQKIVLLAGTDAAGAPVTQPFEPPAAEAAKEPRRRKKSADEPQIPF